MGKVDIGDQQSNHDENIKRMTIISDIHIYKYMYISIIVFAYSNLNAIPLI